MSSLHAFEKKLKESVESADKVIIVPHLYPDFDAIGSAIGLSVLVSSFNKDAYILVDDAKESINDKVLDVINSFYGNCKFINLEEYLQIKSNNDVLLVSDTNKKDMVCVSDYLTDFRDIFIIDHHKMDLNTINTDVDNIFVDDMYSSTCSIVSKFLIDFNVLFSSRVATYLYSGIVLDTNHFTKSVDPYTMSIVTKLLEMGADVEKVNNMFKRDNIQNLKIYKLVNKAKLIKYPLGFAGIAIDNDNCYTREDIAIAADSILDCMFQNDSDLSVINDVNASFVIAPVDSNNYRISARSNSSGIDVCKIMEYIGGGGSKHSAAALVPIDTADKVLKKLYTTLQNS